jgi:hypothetical protein
MINLRGRRERSILDKSGMMDALGLHLGGTFNGRGLSDKGDTIDGKLISVVFDGNLHPVEIRLLSFSGGTIRVPWTAIRSYRCQP